jgi:hypothetical protein
VNPSAVSSLSTSTLSGLWWRAIQTRHLPTPLATSHSTTIPGRFNGGTRLHPGPEVLYLAEDLLVAQFEVGALLGSPLAGHSFLPSPAAVGWSFLPMTVNLNRVLDLTSHVEITKLDTSLQELTGDWRGYGLRLPHHPAITSPLWTNVPTQQLGSGLAASGLFDGLVTYSAKVPTKRNLIIFRNQLTIPNSVEYTDPSTGIISSLP